MKQLKQMSIEEKKNGGNEMTKDEMIELMEKMNQGRKDNMESRRSARNALMNALAVGGKVFAIISLDELHIDASYQP